MVSLSNPIDVLIHIPTWLDRPLVTIALLYRRIRFGYPFRRIPLTQGKNAIVDPEDYERLRKYKWHVNKSIRTYYAVHSLTNGRNAPRKNLRMHHLVIDGLAIDVPPGCFCDHINHNGLDNRKANLRIATRKQNVWHRRKFKRPSRSKYKGVDFISANSGRCWRARIRVNGKRIYLGSFKDEIKAAKAYDIAAKKYHCDFAVLNFPEISRWC